MPASADRFAGMFVGSGVDASHADVWMYDRRTHEDSIATLFDYGEPTDGISGVASASSTRQAYLFWGARESLFGSSITCD